MKTEKAQVNKLKAPLGLAVLAILVLSILFATVALGRNVPVTTTGQSSVQSTRGVSSTSTSESSISQTSELTTSITSDPADVSCPSSCTLNVYWSSINQPYATLASLEAAADFVILGNVTGSLTVASGNVPVTLYNITVTTFLKGGEDIGTPFVMGEVGGMAANKTMTVSGYPTLNVGGTYILFVTPAGGFYSSNGTAHFPNAPFTSEVGEATSPYLVYMTQGGPQGLFYVQNGQVYSLDNLYPQTDSWMQVKASGIPLSQFIQEIQLAQTTSTTSTTSATASTP